MSLIIGTYLDHLCREHFPGQVVRMRENQTAWALSDLTATKRIGVAGGDMAVVYRRMIQHDEVLNNKPSGQNWWLLTESGEKLQSEIVYVPQEGSITTQRYVCDMIRMYKDNIPVKLQVTGDSGIDLDTASGKLLVWYVILSPVSPQTTEQ